MGQPRAKTGAKLRPNRANIGQQQQPPQPRAKTGANLRPEYHNNNNKKKQGRQRQQQHQQQQHHQLGLPGLPFAGARLSGRKPHKIRPGAPWPCPCRRRFSPLRRREGLHPLPPTSPPPKSPAFYGVSCSSHFFLFFGSCGSRWVNHRPQDGPT